jgi:hypothetical protein
MPFGRESIAAVTDETDGALDGESRPLKQSDVESTASGALSAPPEDEFEGATPPGYDWPTHGGYLGCLMGVMAGVLLGGFLGANLLSFIYIDRHLPLPIFILLNAALFLALLIGLGRLGWWLGRRYYRYYPQPAGQSWGEADESEEVELEEATPGADTGTSGSAPEIVAHETPVTGEPEATEQRPA